ncbi:protein phosphatase 2C domain-containing protein [Allorhizobium terrae]|uniref:Protein phosphatase 2C domain-containing protein n=1 Tax=Allorhizobium terrae TaxID=1848972 RepID=A0A4V3W966_9HYPH|nr:protein phosphatase 2C domain-containing protein [Allorhizobium terrae]THF53867.1 protein phosphatase 2C domain-containing protein [Allorhizobium terrae]TWD54574.1 serine/threonine protein phosphatase PrpC [Agrobacterium vitis]
MTAQLTIIDTITDPGKDDRANEDRLGHNADCAFVLDGATGLGDQQYMEGFGSDAAWMAQFAAKRLINELSVDTLVTELIRAIAFDAHELFTATAGEQPRYAWPLCALAALRLTPDGAEFIGLGDSVVYILHDDGRVESLTALPEAFEREQMAARAHVERVGSIGESGVAAHDPQTLSELRHAREKQNTPDGWIWSLGLVPDAADHLSRTDIVLTGGATAIIASDGLADLVSLYHAYDPASLIKRAATAGLKALVAELRHLEREVDPDGVQFPRFKQCDDTTAILCRIEV